MKFFKLATVTAAVLGSTVAMAADVQPYQYDANRNVVSNTAGAVVNTGRTLFDTVTHPGAISAEIGTLGYGANIAWGLNDSIELQAGWSGMSFDDEVDLNSDDSWINYQKALGDEYEDFEGDLKFDVDFSNPYIGLQMRPAKNWFTIGAGVMVPDNKFNGRLYANDNSQGYSSVTIDDLEYRIDNGSNVEIDIENKNTLAPYATIGFRPNINSQWGGFIEAGAAYMGRISSDVNVNAGNITKETSPNSGVFVPATDVEFEQEAQEELQDNDDVWYPIVKAGLTYRF